MKVRVQTEDFDAGAEIARIRSGNPRIGAVVSFIGLMRDVNDGETVQAMALEYYPGMTERALERIVAQAKERWNIIEALVLHRVGNLRPQDQIVLVTVAAEHREPAFRACEFIIDTLKTNAPFWKKEQTASGERWVAAPGSEPATGRDWLNEGEEPCE